MKVELGLKFDGYSPVYPRHSIAESVCGPLGFLDLLETRLGLKVRAVAPAQRVFQFRQALEKVTDCPRFFRDSFKRDPYAVAEVLLRWRDGMIEAGWDGKASPDDSARIQDMAAVEARAKECLSSGVADRLRAVLLELDSRSANLDSLTVLDPPEHWPTLWRRICEKLGGRFEPVGYSAESDASREGSDLCCVQELLRDGAPARRLGLKGDQSIVCVTAFSEVTLAAGTAQWLRRLRQNSRGSLTLVAGAGAGPLEQALSALDEPSLGIRPGSLRRPIPQVLMLALRLYWKPLDPRALLEFLTHPASPVDSALRFKLANAIAECPGVGGASWEAAISSAREIVETSDTLDAVGKQAALERIDKDVIDWLLVADFDAREGAPGSRLAKCCAQVSHWAIHQAMAESIPETEELQFHALAALGSEMARVLESQSSITRSELERLLHQVSGKGWPGGCAIEELGSVHRTLYPGAVHEPVDTVVWWGFSAPPPPPRLPWTLEEQDELRAHGAEFPARESVAVMESRQWVQPFLAARKQLILVFPRERGGEPVAHHPMLVRLRSLLDADSEPLSVIDLDEVICSGTADAPWALERIDHRPLPAMRRWWKLNPSAQLPVRELESYSSCAKFIYDPCAWVLQYKAGLKSGPVAGLRLQDDFRQEGTLLHRILDLLLDASETSIDWRNCTQSEFNAWLDGIWNGLLETEGANLLLAGRIADGLALLETGKRAIWELLWQLRKANVIEAKANVTMPRAPFAGGQIHGIIDLLVRNDKNDCAVVDLKFGGQAIREKELQENRPLQLAIYGHLVRCSGQSDWPASAFFLLRRRSLIAAADAFFPNAKVIASNRPAGRDGDLLQCWNDFETVWQWRRQQLDDGWIELAAVSPQSSESPDEAPESIPPIRHWIADEDHAQFSDFDALIGWSPDA